MKKVQRGRFTAIPEDLTYKRGGEDLASLVDGVDLLGSEEKCRAICARVIQEVDICGRSSATALDQLIALHWAVLSARKSGGVSIYNLSGNLDALTWSIRDALVNLTPYEKYPVMAAIEASEARA